MAIEYKGPSDDARRTHEIEQHAANLRAILPPLWFGIYQGCREAGFTEENAMRCVTAYIHAKHGDA